MLWSMVVGALRQGLSRAIFDHRAVRYVSFTWLTVAVKNNKLTCVQNNNRSSTMSQVEGEPSEAKLP
jgi:hypothetical protein